LSQPRSPLDELREQFARTLAACDACVTAGPAEMRAAVEAAGREVQTLLAILHVVKAQVVATSDQEADELVSLTLELQRRFSKLPAHAYRALMDALRHGSN
jgi:epoxyqueuosine reductase QueG